MHGLAPRVAITQNGTRKRATVQTSRILNSSPNLEDIWQLHWSYNGGTEHNPAGLFIANIDEPAVIATVLTSPPPAGRGGPPAAAPVATPAPGATPTMPTAGPPAVTTAPPAAAAPAPVPVQPGGAPAAVQPGAAPVPVDPAAAPPAGGRQGGGGGRGGPGPAHTGAGFSSPPRK